MPEQTKETIEVLASRYNAAREASKLRDKRTNLSNGLAGALASLADQKDRCYQENIGLAPYETAIADFQTALAAFDASHPEVLAAIEAERAERIERNIGN